MAVLCPLFTQTRYEIEELCSHDLFHLFSLFYRGVCVLYSEEDTIYFLVTDLDSLVLVRVKACEMGYFADKRAKEGERFLRQVQFPST